MRVSLQLPGNQGDAVTDGAPSGRKKTSDPVCHATPLQRHKCARSSLLVFPTRIIVEMGSGRLGGHLSHGVSSPAAHRLPFAGSPAPLPVPRSPVVVPTTPLCGRQTAALPAWTYPRTQLRRMTAARCTRVGFSDRARSAEGCTLWQTSGDFNTTAAAKAAGAVCRASAHLSQEIAGECQS